MGCRSCCMVPRKLLLGGGRSGARAGAGIGASARGARSRGFPLVRGVCRVAQRGLLSTMSLKRGREEAAAAAGTGEGEGEGPGEPGSAATPPFKMRKDYVMRAQKVAEDDLFASAGRDRVPLADAVRHLFPEHYTTKTAAKKACRHKLVLVNGDVQMCSGKKKIQEKEKEGPHAPTSIGQRFDAPRTDGRTAD